MAAGEAFERRLPPDLFTILSFNCNKRADLGGLSTLLRENRPDFVFIQEVNVSPERLAAAVGGLGYRVHISMRNQPNRVIAVLSCNGNVSVVNLIPGILQKVTFKNFSIFHLHTPTDPSLLTKAEFFQQLSDFLSQIENNLPILVGDFNCVIDAKDHANSNDGHNRFSYPLKNIISLYNLIDAYRVLHPTTVRFSWHRKGFASARLDRVYLPPILEARPRVARYIPTTSDHHAFMLKMDMTGFGTTAAKRPPAHFYWKFNSSLLQEKDFLPAFREMWGPVEAAEANYQAGPGAWWEELAKPAIGGFCRRFARLIAGRRAATRRFFVRALELALEGADWVVAEACKEKMAAIDAKAAAGLAVRSGQPTVEGEIPGLFHAAMEGRHGPFPRSTGRQDGRRQRGKGGE